ncbi:MAG: exodeoxyribonuclease VII large subunit [Planctomycetota bacterium]
MPRLFDESEPPRPPEKPPSQPDKALSVAQLIGAIKGAINDRLPGKVRVVGEVSNLSDRNHWFFSLKDGEAVIRCVMFASAARAVRLQVRDGLEVVATGRVDVFPGQGAVQLYVDRLEPVGQGDLELRLREMIEQLRGLGYFDPAKKKPLPAVPTRVAVVTSRSAAALQDVINTAQRRWPGCELLHLDVRVQGESAAAEIAHALDKLSDQGDRLGIDAIILTRGGGSIEDLWAFNERVVIDAVYACRVPIVAAVGHETDTTVTELVADHRCATPTQAAMTLVPDRALLAQQIDQAADRLRLALRRRAEYERQRLAGLSRHPAMSRPDRLTELPRSSVEQLMRRLSRALPGRVDRDRPRLERLADDLPNLLRRRVMLARLQAEQLEKQLQAVGPQRVLDRGYTLTLDGSGKPIRSARSAAQAGTLTTVFSDGRVDSRVDPDTGSGSSPQPPPASRPKRKRKPRADEGPGLFT